MPSCDSEGVLQVGISTKEPLKRISGVSCDHVAERYDYRALLQLKCQFMEDHAFLWHSSDATVGRGIFMKRGTREHT